jgi:hypothetical protein
MEYWRRLWTAGIVSMDRSRTRVESFILDTIFQEEDEEGNDKESIASTTTTTSNSNSNIESNANTHVYPLALFFTLDESVGESRSLESSS